MVNENGGWTQKVGSCSVQIVTPGEVIAPCAGYLRGHGTYIADEQLIASVAGVVERVNKLISVIPLKQRYLGDVGDVVVGRIVEVGQKRWLVDIGGRQASVLQLASVNLPGGAQRRRTAEDQLQMRTIFAENDLVSAEVHSFFSDSSVALHTRSMKYGKLVGGTLIEVPCGLMKRMKQHFHTLPNGVSIILANNGFVWIAPERPCADGQQENEEPPQISLDDMTDEMREKISRVRNCVQVLASGFMSISPKSIMEVYNESLSLSPAAILEPSLSEQLTRKTAARQEEDDKLHKSEDS